MKKEVPVYLKKIINFIGYLVTWITSVYSAAHCYIWPGFLVALIFLMIHFKLCDSIKHELKIIVLVTLLGCSIDSALNYYHYLAFAGANPWYPFSPPWLWGIWMAFGATLNSSLAIFQRHRFIAAGSGAVDLPMTYLIGQKIGAIHFIHLLNALSILSLLWMVLLPIATWIAQPTKK